MKTQEGMGWRVWATTSVLGCAVRGRWKVVLPGHGKRKGGRNQWGVVEFDAGMFANLRKQLSPECKAGQHLGARAGRATVSCYVFVERILPREEGHPRTIFGRALQFNFKRPSGLKVQAELAQCVERLYNKRVFKMYAWLQFAHQRPLGEWGR